MIPCKKKNTMYFWYKIKLVSSDEYEIFNIYLRDTLMR